MADLLALAPLVLLLAAGLRWPRWWEGGNKTWSDDAVDHHHARQALGRAVESARQEARR